MRTRIKFCGITRRQDALDAISLGVDAIGLVFTPRSPRHVDIAAARAILDALPPMVTRVALFMDDDAAWIDEVVAQVKPDLLQFHGDESAQSATRHARNYVKALPMASIDTVLANAAQHPDALAFLLDSHQAGGMGGTGERFDWTRVPSLARPIVLAGGLDASNVAHAIALVRPYAVDVSSGIESILGIKDLAKMRAFVEAVRAADAR